MELLRSITRAAAIGGAIVALGGSIAREWGGAHTAGLKPYTSYDDRTTIAEVPGETHSLAVPNRANAHVSLAADGAFVVAVWAASAGGSATDIFAAVSRDGGVTFSAPSRVNSTAGDARVSGEQPPRVALVRRSTATPSIVVVWTAKRDSGTALLTARSENAGRTFSRSALVRGSDAAGNRGWEAVATIGRGVQTIWLDHRNMAKGEASPGAGAHQHAGHDTSTAKIDGAAMAQLSSLYVASLDDNMPAREITKGVCYCCKTALATRPDGSVFAAWRHVYPGNLRDIAFTVSRDRGRTFAPPIRVSEDNWILDGCPDDGPTMAVDRAGTVHIVWPTLVGDPEPHVALMYASSRDGRTFTARTQVPTLGSLKPSHPQAIVAGDELVLVWDEVLSGKRRVATNLAPIGPEGARFGLPHAISDADSSVYPFVTAVPGAVLVAWTSGAPDSSAIVIRRVTPSAGTR